MEIVFPRIACYLYDVYLENKDSGNCAQLIEEEFYKMFDLNDEHDCNVASINSLNIHDASDMPSPKLGDAMFDEYDIFSPPSFDEQNNYDYSMPPIYGEYCDDMFAIKSTKSSMLVHHKKGAVCDGYIVEFIHDAAKIFYERGSYAFTYCKNSKFPLYVLKVLKSCLFCLRMLVDSWSNKLFVHKIPMHRKWVRLKCV
jgi:hypothetical protein